MASARLGRRSVDCWSGAMRLGTLGNQQPDGDGYSADDVQRIMRQLWAEYVASANSELFKG